MDRMTSHSSHTHGRHRIRNAVWQSTAPVPTAKLSLASPAISLLVGTVLGWLVAALCGPLERTFDPPAKHGVVVAAMLLCVAIGTRLPHRLARGLAVLTWKRRKGARVGDAPDSTSTDMQLLMTVLGAVAMLTGLAIAASPLLIRLAGWSYRITVGRFFWLSWTYPVLVAAITCLATMLPIALTGFLLTCINQLTRQDRKWALTSLPWVLLGCGTGVALFSTTGTLTAKWELLVVVAAVPMLAIAIVAVRHSKHLTSTIVTPPPLPLPPVQACINPMFNRLADIIVTAAASCLMILWYRCMLMDTRSPLGSGELPVVLLWAAALGTGWGGGTMLNIAGRRPGFGLICVAAGGVNFATVFLITFIDRLPGSTADIYATALPCFAISAAAFAVARLRRTILVGTTHRNATESLLVSETAWIPACAMMAFAIIAPDLDQLYWTITSFAVGLSVVGLFVVLQQPRYHAAGKNVRLTAAVCSISVMVFLWPHIARRWKTPSIDAPSRSTSQHQTENDFAVRHTNETRWQRRDFDITAYDDPIRYPNASGAKLPNEPTNDVRPKKTATNATPAAFCVYGPMPSSLLGRHPISSLP